MAFNWTVKQSSIPTVKSAIDASLQKMSMPSFASVNWEGDELCVKIDKAGKSEFRIGLKSSGDTVSIVETKRNLSMFHKPFVGKVEEIVDRLMSEAGAAKV